MPKLTNSTPKYSKHRASGQAICKIEGRTIYLGPYGTKASRVEYDRVVSEWLAHGRRLPDAEDANTVTVAMVLAAYLRHAGTYYRKNGRPTSEVAAAKHVMQFVRRLYGRETATDFGPLKLKAVRESMIQAQLCRGTVNQHLGRIKRIFRWAASEEMIPASVPQALRTVSGLRRGRSHARETAPVKPVEDAIIEATLPHLPDTVAGAQ